MRVNTFSPRFFSVFFFHPSWNIFIWNLYHFIPDGESTRMNTHRKTYWNRSQNEIDSEGWMRVCEYESVYYSCIGIILLFIFPFLFDNILWYIHELWNSTKTRFLAVPSHSKRKKNIFLTSLSFYRSLRSSFASSSFLRDHVDFITLTMVTFALLPIWLWVHQTDTTYLKIYGLVLNHVWACVLEKQKNLWWSHILRTNCMNFYRMCVWRPSQQNDNEKNQQQQIETIGWSQRKLIYILVENSVGKKNRIAIVFRGKSMRARGERARELCIWHNISWTCKNFLSVWKINAKTKRNLYSCAIWFSLRSWFLRR